MAASRSRSIDSEDDYSNRYDSDDFASDDDIVSMKQPAKPPAKKSNPYLNSKGRGRGRGRGQSKQSSKQTTPRPGESSVAKRMMSASRIKMNEYRNQMEEQYAQIQDLSIENKTLKKMHFRQEKALGKFEEKEGELPQLLTKHSNEVRALREQNRRIKEKFNTTDRYLRDAEDEIDVLKGGLKKYKTLADKKGLPERDVLDRKVRQAEINLEEKDSRIKELERHIDVLNKNHRHEIGIEFAHQREMKKQLKELDEKQRHVQDSLREKEKELEIKNIYSNRIMKAPHKLPSSYNGTPLGTPPPARRKRAPSLTDITSRDKVKLYEEKRREEKQKLDSPRRTKKVKETWKANDEQSSDKSQEIVLTMYESKIKSEDDADLWVQRERDRIEHEKKEQREREENQKIEDNIKKEQEMMKQESKEIRRLENEREERMRDEARRLKEDQDRNEQVEQQKGKEKQERAKAERERREEEERKRVAREQEEQDRLADAERLRLQNDPKAIEERRKKDLLLARLKQIDNTDETKSDPVSPQRATFIGTNRENSLDSNSSIKSAYSFTKPVENMHQGLPSHDDVTVPYLERQRKLKAQKEDLEIGGYQPSFAKNTFSSDSISPKPGNTNKNTISRNDDFRKTSIPASPDKKSKLLKDLFGKKSEDANSNDDLFSSNPTKKSAPLTQSGFPWDDKPNHGSPPKRENSSTLFGGGSALIDDDAAFDTNASKMLPRRMRQQASTFSSKPAVSAIDHFDDDIEEVML